MTSPLARVTIHLMSPSSTSTNECSKKVTSVKLGDPQPDPLRRSSVSNQTVLHRCWSVSDDRPPGKSITTQSLLDDRFLRRSSCASDPAGPDDFSVRIDVMHGAESKKQAPAFRTPPESPSVSYQVGHGCPSVIIDIQPNPERDALAEKLGALEFHCESEVDPEKRQAMLNEQVKMQDEFLDWAGKVYAARKKAFGPNARYVPGENMDSRMSEGLLPAVYDGVRKFISSALRSPSRNAVVTKLAPQPNGQGGELSNDVDPQAYGGLVGGVTAYLVEKFVLSPMDKRAKLANFPTIEPVDVKALVPEPCKVQLRMIDGTPEPAGPRRQSKEFWRPVSDNMEDTVRDDAPLLGTRTLPSLKDEAKHRRESLRLWQNALQGKDLSALLLQPTLTGAANVLRRAVTSTEHLLEALPVFEESALASGSAGAISYFGLGMAKVAPWLSQADIDDLLGGKQRVNLFSLRVPDPSPNTRPAQWSDICGLPRYLLDSGWEAFHLLRHVFHGPPEHVVRQLVDFLACTAANTGASFFSAGGGQFFAKVLRDGSPRPAEGEPLNSSVNLWQQGFQSASNDFLWQAFRELLKGLNYNLADSLDRKRADKQAALWHQALLAVAPLHELVQRYQELANKPLGEGVAKALEELAVRLEERKGIPIECLQRAFEELQKVTPDKRTVLYLDRLLPVFQQVLQPLGQYETLARLRGPQPVDGAAT